MKLAVIRQRYTPYGGAERFLERALSALGSGDLDITVIAREWPQDMQSAYQCLLLKSFHIGRSWRDAAFAHAACRAVAAGNYDLVQSHERLSCCDIYRAGDGVHLEWLIQRARHRGFPAMLSDRLSLFHRRILAAERDMFSSPRLKAVICNSRMVKDEIVQHFGVAETRLHVIRNAVDSTLFNPDLRGQFRDSMRQRLGIGADRNVFLMVGSGFERKGVDLLLKVWPELDSRSVLVVVGHDRHLDRYRARLGSRGLAGRCFLVGPQQDVRPWYGTADAFVLPTLYDPCPNAALEALACGLPVLTSSKSGAAELITPGKNGDVCDAHDHAGWLRLLQKWSDAERCRLALPSARQAIEAYSQDAMQNLFQSLYASVLDSK